MQRPDIAMKPLHVGLLVVGAAVAGGLAVRMTEPVVFQRTPVIAPAAPVAPAATVKPPVVPVVATAPPAVYTEEAPPVREPSPVTRVPAPKAPTARTMQPGVVARMGSPKLVLPP